MTIEEAKTFLDNLKVCIEEHPIVADWLVEIADRKTEPTSSKMEQVETMSCQECKHWDDIRNCWIMKSYGECHYEPKEEPQTERSE